MYLFILYYLSILHNTTYIYMYTILMYTIYFILYYNIVYNIHYTIYIIMYTIFMYTIHNIQYTKLSTINYYLSTINLWISLLISISISVFPTLLKVIHNFFLPYMANIIPIFTSGSKKNKKNLKKKKGNKFKCRIVYINKTTNKHQLNNKWL